MRFDSTIHSFRLYCLGLFALGCSLAGHSGESGSIQRAEGLFPQLETILETALKQSPRMVLENLDLLEAEQQKLISSSVLYPDASFNATVARRNEARLQNDGSTEDVTLWRTFYFGSINQPLFYWGALRSRAEIGKIRAEIESNNFVEAYRVLALEVRRSFLALIIEKAAIEGFERRVEDVDTRIQTLRIAVELGAESKEGLSAALTESEKVELARDRALRKFEDSVALFGRFTGIDSFDADQVPDEIPKVLLSKEMLARSLYDNYVEQNQFEGDPRYISAMLRVETERLNESVIKTNLRPTFDLTAGISQDERSDTVNVADRYQFTAYFAGVNVRWRIFDGYESRGRRMVAGTKRMKLEHRVQEREYNLVRAVERSVSDLGFATRSLELAERSLRGAEIAVERAREDFEMGQISANAIATAESRALSVRLDAFRGRAAYLRASATLLSNLGADPIVEAAIPEIVRR